MRSLRWRTVAHVIAQYGVADVGEPVGQRTGGLVVVGAPLNGRDPGSRVIELSLRIATTCCGPQYGTRPMGEQHAQRAVAPFGDTPQPTRIARREFLGCEAEPAGEMPCVLEVRHVASGGRHIALHRQRSQKRLHLILAHLRRMPLAVKKNEALDSIQISNVRYECGNVLDAADPAIDRVASAQYQDQPTPGLQRPAQSWRAWFYFSS